MGSSPFLETSACQDARVGPCELIKITDFIGYDSEQRPGASARVEQTLGQKSGVFSPKDYIDNILQDLMYKLYTNYNVTIFAVHCSSR